MSFERPDIFEKERIIMGGNVSVIVKDPDGLGRVLSSDRSMTLITHEETEERSSLGGEVVYYPADSINGRSLFATIGYLPNRKRLAKQDLSLIHAALLDSGTSPYDVMSAGSDKWNDPYLNVSVGDAGDGMTICVGARNSGHATGVIGMELTLPFSPEFERDQELVSRLLLNWGIVRSAMNGPRHRKGVLPLAIVVDNMSFDDHASDLWQVIAGFDGYGDQSDETMPELSINQSELEYLLAAYPMDTDTLTQVIEQLLMEHLVASDVDSKPAPVTIHDIARYFDALGR